MINFIIHNTHTGFSDDNPAHAEYVHYSLKKIASALETRMHLIITNSHNDPNFYDLSLNTTNLEELNKRLLFHGLELKQVKGEIDMLKITFH